MPIYLPMNFRPYFAIHSSRRAAEAMAAFALAWLGVGPSATAADSNPSSPNPVHAEIQGQQPGAPISPYVYGQFLEHIGEMVYRALWSEMIDDRKFYYPVGPEPQPKDPAKENSFFGRRDPGPGRWNPIGPAESVAMDTQDPFAGDHSPAITMSGNDPRGVQQRHLLVEKGQLYRGRIALAAGPDVTVSIELQVGDGAEAPIEIVRLGALSQAYRKFTFSFRPAATGEATFKIVGRGKGTLHIGAVSLMPDNNPQGFKPDAIAALRSLHSAVYRIPGGNFVSAHEWRDAIGDPDKRPPIKDPVWNAVQSNDIGTDEFLTLCRLLEVEPYITVNAGTGDEWSAAQYVEYTNGSVGTPMAKLRAQNGHPEPYHVKFWGIGNEMWGNYQFGYMPLAQFEFKHRQFAKAMKRVDPHIVLIASGAMPDTMTGSKQSLVLGHDLIPAYLSPADWTGNLLEHCFDDFDLVSEHFYNFGNTHFDLAKAEQLPNAADEPLTDWMRRPANHVRLKYEEYEEYKKLLPNLVAHPKPINLDEWAYTPGPHSAFPAYAMVFHEMFRHSDLYQMAAHTFATALITREGSAVKLNSLGLVFQLYRDHFGNLPLEVTGNSPPPPPAASVGGEQPAVNAGSPTFPLDVSAAWKDNRSLTLAVINPTDHEQTLELELDHIVVQGPAQSWTLQATDAQHATVNAAEVKEFKPSLKFPPLSVTILELPAQRSGS